MTIETALEFVAESIDGKLQVCDDGYVICVKTGKHEIDFIYDESGTFEETKVKA